MLKSFFQEELPEAGCDEAGRGCLAGPVFAAAVILPPDFSHPLLNDSKQLKEVEREAMRMVIEERAVGWAVAMVDHHEIDQVNILRASIRAMHLALDRLPEPPGMILVDGNYFIRYRKVRHRCFIKGDATYASIAAASVLAKTYRDAYMVKLHEFFPQYGWNHNKGYATEAHRKALAEYGLSEYHRRSFQCLPRQLQMEF